MSLVIPDYVAKSGVADAPVAHGWDDANPDRAYLKPDEMLRKKIDMSSYRGLVALSLGFAEWTAWRLHAYEPDRTLLQFIEAGWASVVDWRYLANHPILRWAEWRGPVRGPLCAACLLLWDVIRITRKVQFASPESVGLSQLAVHVLPDAKSFKQWRRSAIEGLARAYPRRPEDLLGTPVPREALDPGREYKPEDAKRFISEFLSKVQPSENPYLASPENMKSAGFEGTPYTY